MFRLLIRYARVRNVLSENFRRIASNIVVNFTQSQERLESASVSFFDFEYASNDVGKVYERKPNPKPRASDGHNNNSTTNCKNETRCKKFGLLKMKQPMFSMLNANQHKLYLQLYRKFSKHPPTTPQEHKQLIAFKELQGNVLQEQNEYMKYLKDLALLNYEDYMFIHPSLLSFYNRYYELGLKRVLGLPPYYILHDVVQLTNNSNNNNQFSRPMPLLQIGRVPKCNETKLKKTIGSLLKKKAMKKLMKMSPETLQSTSDFVTSDENITTICKSHGNVDVVMSYGGLECLFDNHPPLFNKQWNLPILVVKDPWSTTTRVIIDDPLPPIQATPPEKSTYTHQELMHHVIKCLSNNSYHHLEDGGGDGAGGGGGGSDGTYVKEEANDGGDEGDDDDDDDDGCSDSSDDGGGGDDNDDGDYGGRNVAMATMEEDLFDEKFNNITQLELNGILLNAPDDDDDDDEGGGGDGDDDDGGNNDDGGVCDDNDGGGVDGGVDGGDDIGNNDKDDEVIDDDDDDDDDDKLVIINPLSPIQSFDGQSDDKVVEGGGAGTDTPIHHVLCTIATDTTITVTDTSTTNTTTNTNNSNNDIYPTNVTNITTNNNNTASTNIDTINTCATYTGTFSSTDDITDHNDISDSTVDGTFNNISTLINTVTAVTTATACSTVSISSTGTSTGGNSISGGGGFGSGGGGFSSGEMGSTIIIINPGCNADKVSADFVIRSRKLKTLMDTTNSSTTTISSTTSTTTISMTTTSTPTTSTTTSTPPSTSLFSEFPATMAMTTSSFSTLPSTATPVLSLATMESSTSTNLNPSMPCTASQNKILLPMTTTAMIMTTTSSTHISTPTATTPTHFSTTITTHFSTSATTTTHISTPTPPTTTQTTTSTPTTSPTTRRSTRLGKKQKYFQIETETKTFGNPRKRKRSRGDVNRDEPVDITTCCPTMLSTLETSSSTYSLLPTLNVNNILSSSSVKSSSSSSSSRCHDNSFNVASKERKAEVTLLDINIENNFNSLRNVESTTDSNETKVKNVESCSSSTATTTMITTSSPIFQSNISQLSRDVENEQKLQCSTQLQQLKKPQHLQQHPQQQHLQPLLPQSQQHQQPLQQQQQKQHLRQQQQQMMQQQQQYSQQQQMLQEQLRQLKQQLLMKPDITVPTNNDNLTYSIWNVNNACNALIKHHCMAHSGHSNSLIDVQVKMEYQRHHHCYEQTTINEMGRMWLALFMKPSLKKVLLARVDACSSKLLDVEEHTMESMNHNYFLKGLSQVGAIIEKCKQLHPGQYIMSHHTSANMIKIKKNVLNQKGTYNLHKAYEQQQQNQQQTTTIKPHDVVNKHWLPIIVNMENSRVPDKIPCTFDIRKQMRAGNRRKNKNKKK